MESDFSERQRQRVVDAEHPWLGLSPFTEATQEFFFGRDQEIRDIFVRVREQTLTILYGQSGLGKTSLLGAGLIPKLKVERFRPALLRLEYGPTDPPLLEQVRQALRDVVPIPERNDDDNGADHPSVPFSLWEMFHDLRIRPSDLSESPPVLIFDQFEEVFTLADDRVRQTEAQELFGNSRTCSRTARRHPFNSVCSPIAVWPGTTNWVRPQYESSSRCVKTFCRTWNAGRN